MGAREFGDAKYDKMQGQSTPGKKEQIVQTCCRGDEEDGDVEMADHGRVIVMGDRGDDHKREALYPTVVAMGGDRK